MRVEYLFPEVANLHGDHMNVRYLAASCGAEVVKTSLKRQPLFVTERPDLIYMGPMTEWAQELAIAALRPYRERILELIEDGTVFLITGNAFEVFGDEIENEDGSKIPALGIYHTRAKREMMNRYNAIYLGKFHALDDLYIVGFKSQFGHSYGDNQNHYLFETVRSAGLNPSVKTEGIRIRNLFATYLIGPLLLLNPEFTRYFMRLMGVKDPQPAFYDAAMASYEKRLSEYLDFDRALS